MIEIACNFGVNIHINKCHAISLNVILLNVVRKKFKIFWGISLSVKLFCRTSNSRTDDLRSITYYIICTLTRIENMLIYVAHANMHCDWTIYYFIKTIFGIWVKD